MHQERYISEKVAAMWNYPTRSSAVAGNPTRPIWTSCLSPFKAVLTTAANVKLGEIQAIDYSWGEIDFVTKPLNEMRLMECTECEMSAPGAYDIDIEADDINVTDTATVIWEIA